MLYVFHINFVFSKELFGYLMRVFCHGKGKGKR
jgi:hypothetical protein